MHILDFPVDVLFCVADFLPLSALNSLQQTNRKLHGLFEPWLYRYDAPAALAWAAEHGHEEAARKALGAGASVQPVTECWDAEPVSLLQIACRHGHVKVVELLLAQDGVDLNWALAEPDFRHTWPWCDNRWHIDRLCMTPLMHAALYGHAEVVKLLLDQPGVDVRATDHVRRTAMNMTIEGRHVSVFEAILAHERGRALVFRPSLDFGTTFRRALGREALDIAWRLLTTDGLQPHVFPEEAGVVYNFFLLKGLSAFLKKVFLLPNPHTKSGYFYNYQTPLAAAIARGEKSAVESLLDNREVDPTGPDNGGLTPLTLAVCLENEEIVQLLLAPGRRVYPNIGDNAARPPIWIAASLGHTRMVELLLADDRVHPFNVGKVSNGTVHAHTIAAEHGHIEIVELLLARVDIGNGMVLESVLDLPAEFQPRVMEFLSSRSASMREVLMAKIAAKEENEKRLQKLREEENDKRKGKRSEKDLAE
jgi:ankyrin repeat protein